MDTLLNSIIPPGYYAILHFGSSDDEHEREAAAQGAAGAQEEPGGGHGAVPGGGHHHALEGLHPRAQGHPVRGPLLRAGHPDHAALPHGAAQDEVHHQDLPPQRALQGESTL
ncbi:unnamed protein product [Phytophthora lilii]|uniref:Unnamed protein product n=1 Tax=Phytophthora lilii TaxID=2077276 RepID=A0A9W6TIQ2_9STRA|nr:unnamed protein product [Phytophthora lilii]